MILQIYIYIYIYDLGETIREGRARVGGTVRVQVKVMGCVMVGLGLE